MVKKRITESVTSDDAKSKRWRTLFASARMAYESGEFRQAESNLARAMELAKDIPERTFAVHATEIGTAAVWLVTNRSREAEARLSKSITSLESYSEDNCRELLAVALRFHAQTLINAGDTRAAEQALKRSALILGEIGTEASVQMAYTLCDLSGLYVIEGRISEAGKYIMDAMQILSAVCGPEHPEYARADMIYKLCLPMESGTFLDTASEGLMTMQYFYGSKHPNVARALDRYIKVLNERGDTARLEEAKLRFGLNRTAKK